MNLEELKWRKFPVGSDGFICLVDVMGDDSSVVQAARVSYGDGTKQVSDDRTLIRYLMRHRHTTPFEMSELKFLVRVPMDTWRQWIRQRTASVNEYSTRYSKAIDSMAVTNSGEWRSQSSNNKQGSDGFISEWSDSENRVFQDKEDGRYYVNSLHEDYYGGFEEQPTPGEYLSFIEESFHELAKAVYNERLNMGVAREQARKDLPLSTLTEAYWKIDLHNLLNFLSQRMDSHAQKEIRDYANVIGNEIVRPLFPLVWEAFEDYRLGAVTLSRLDVEMLRLLPHRIASGPFAYACREEPFISHGWDKERCRERDECRAKLERLGFVF